ncbi:paired amphipathic helix protein Sin3-like protein 2 isoform X1, partial [Tanacetum coccineum]
MRKTIKKTKRIKTSGRNTLMSKVIMEYLVNISKRRAFWSLNENILKIIDSDNQYAVSIKKIRRICVIALAKDHEETRSIRRIQRRSIRRIEDIVCEYSGRYQAWSLLQETPIRPDLVAYGDHNGSNAKAKRSMEIDADAVDEDNENALEGIDDVSVKGSKGEAEGIRDANFVGANDTYSDCIFLSAKPLAKCVAFPLHDGGKKECNIFYGNESFYTLLRLHQVRYIGANECEGHFSLINE